VTAVSVWLYHSGGNPPDMSDAPEGPADDITTLVDRNGLVKLFANRVRARILVTLFYAEDPLTTADIAAHADVYQSAVIEALEAMEPFDIVESTGDDEDPAYAIDRSDELVADIRTLAESATNRLYGGES